MLKFDWNALFVLINLIVFFLLMKKFLFGRIAKVIEERRSLIDAQFEEAKNANDAAQERLNEYENKLSDYQSEGEQLIEEAKTNAKAEYDKIIRAAETDADTIKTQAREQMEAEAQAARKAAKEELASLAMEAAEKVVGANISEATNSAIFDEFLNEGSDGE